MKESVSLGQDVKVFDLDTSIPGDPLLVVVGTKNYQIGGLAKLAFLCLEKGIQSTREIQSRFLCKNGYECHPGQLQRIMAQLASSGIVQFVGEADKPKKQRNRSGFFSHAYFAIRVPLLSQKRLEPLSSRFARLLSPYWMPRVAPFLLALQIFFLSRVHSFGVMISRGSIHGTVLAWFLLGNYLGLFLHELGHAAACVRCGIKHGPIGFGIYLIFPAFYTDVSEAWQLPRSLRTVVDAAGLYMSLLAATIAALLFLWSGLPVFGLLAAVYDLTVLVNLNPFVRMDGYWLLSDLLGVQNLMATNTAVSKWFFGLLVRKRTNPRPQVLGMRPRFLYPYLLYYVLFSGFVCIAGFRLLSWYLPHLLASYPPALRSFVAIVVAYGISWEALKNFIGLALRGLPALGLFIYSCRLLARGIRWIKKGISSSILVVRIRGRLSGHRTRHPGNTAESTVADQSFS